MYDSEDAFDLAAGSYRSKLGQAPKEAEVFTVSFTKPPGYSAGMDLDLLGFQFGQVCRVFRNGLVANYNTFAPNSKRVCTGDFLVEVNGVRGDIKQMLRRIEEDLKVEMVLIRPVPFKVVINHVPGELVNSVKCAPTGVSLLLYRSCEALETLRQEQPSLALRDHDCITCVNGIGGSTEAMTQELRSARRLILLVARVVRDGGPLLPAEPDD